MSTSSAIPRICPAKDCKLYRVEVKELLNNMHLHPSILESLTYVSKGKINKDRLKKMARNPRHQLYVLLGPTENWNQHGFTVYCAIQTCLVGKISDLPELKERDSFGDQVKTFFVYYLPLYAKSLVGAQVVGLFTWPDAPEEDYGSFSLKLLTRYFDGNMSNEATEVVPLIGGNIITPLQKRMREGVHYLSAFVNLTLDDFLFWERCEFMQFCLLTKDGEPGGRFVMLNFLRDYEKNISAADKACSPIHIFKYFRAIFAQSSCKSWSSLNPNYALRLLKYKNQTIQDRAIASRKLLKGEKDVRRVVRFLKLPGGNVELIAHLLWPISQHYFNGWLPIDLSEIEEIVLLIKGMQKNDDMYIKEHLNLLDNEIQSSLKGVFEKVLLYYNSSPEDANGDGNGDDDEYGLLDIYGPNWTSLLKNFFQVGDPPQ